MDAAPAIFFLKEIAFMISGNEMVVYAVNPQPDFFSEKLNLKITYKKLGTGTQFRR